VKLLMFRHHDERRMGVARGDRAQEVVDLAALARVAGATSLPADLLGLIEAGDAGLGLVRELLALPPSTVGPHVRKLTGLALLAPLDPPRGDVLAIGRNYGKHASESAQAWGEEVKPPTVFSKAQTSVTGPFDDIAIDPRISDQIDWEVELGVVIGRTALNLKPADAMRHVFGYTVVNDISARDIQNGWGGQYFKGKSLDRSSPIGPWIVTADEIPDPQQLRLSLRVNGVTKQDGNTADMLYPVAQVVAWLSIGMTLRSGTLIATGTPDGVGFARTPPEFLRPGDVLETEVEGIGLMRNRMVSATVLAERER
jgi:2-keto-4-pentenoate hydratase/2-oxohepta-3-ene-1,7-dioic acid hydratase in catechol pathway